jgi:hypothetical protein
MNFRSYIDSFSDSYSSKWKDITYMGRGESFKKYDGFDRDISMAFTVVAHSQREMCGIYEKLNTLASSVAPTYTSAGYMAGNLVKMSVGGYIREQYGIITGFTYDIPEEASWELTIGAAAAIKDELPMMIKVTGLKFTPIYDFVPQYNSGGGFSRRFITKLMTDCGTSCPPKKITVCNDPNATNYQKKDIGAVINDKSGNGTHKYVADNKLCKYKNDTVQFIKVCNQQGGQDELGNTYDITSYLTGENGKKYSESQVKSGATIETRKNTSGNTTTITTIKLKGDPSVCKKLVIVEEVKDQFYEQARDNTATPGIPGGTQTTPGGLITPGQNNNNDVQSPIPNVYDEIIAKNTKTDSSGRFSTKNTNEPSSYFDKQTGQLVTCPAGTKAVLSFARSSGYVCQ